MERIQNCYCLHSINDWLLALEQGLVKKMKKEQYSLEEILKLTECDCLPLNIVCARCNGDNYILADDQLDKLFGFLKNEITVYDGKQKVIYFSDLPPQKRQEILAATVSSVWVSA